MNTVVTTGALYVSLELGCDKWVRPVEIEGAQRPRHLTKEGVDRLKQRLPDIRVGFGPAVK